MRANIERILDGRVAPGRVAAVLLVAAGALTACGDHERTIPAEEREPVEVATSVAEPTTLPTYSESTGTVEPWARVAPGTKILSRVERVEVREGDRVERGRILATLESRDLEAAVEQTRAAVSMAEANLENARAQHDRIRQLHARGSATDKNLEDAVAGFRVAEASLRQAEANRSAAVVTLGYARIASPIGGWVVAKHVEAGDMASPGMPMFVIEDLSRVKVVLDVAESEVVGLERGEPAKVRVDVLDRSWDASIDRVVPSGDLRSRTYRVELVLSNPDGALKSGMFVRAGFSRGSRETLTVPTSSVVRRGQLVGLFVVGDDGRARLRWVRLREAAIEDGPVSEVLSGLSAGERYVVSPPPGFADGTPVVTR